MPTPTALSAKQQTELTMLISSRKWSAAKIFLKKNVAAKASAASNDDDGTPKPTLGLYLLHLALRSMAPLSIIAILLDPARGGHRLSVTTPESSTGMLPLHLACRYGASPSVVNLILMHHPSAIDVKDEADKTAMDYAKSPTYPQQSGTGQVEVVAVLKRAEGYQTIAAMVQRQAGAEMEQRLEMLEARHSQAGAKTFEGERQRHESELEQLREETQTKEEENRRLRQKLDLLRRGLELERSDRLRQEDERKARQASADGSVATLLGQLRQELYATQKWAVIMELEALAAKSTASNLERRLSHAEEDLAALKDATNQSVFSSMFGPAGTTEGTSAQRIRQLEELIDTKDEESVRLARRVAKLESMLQTANDTIENLENENDAFKERIKDLEDEAGEGAGSGSPAQRGRSRNAKSLESRDATEVVQPSENEVGDGNDDDDDDDAAPFYALEGMQTALKRAISGGEELMNKDLTQAKDKLSASGNPASPKSTASITSLFSACL